MTFKNNIFTNPLILPDYVRRDVAKYLVIAAVLSVIMDIVAFFTTEQLFISGLLFFSMMFIFLPFCLFIAYTLKRLIRKATGKATAHDKTVKFWILTRMAFLLLMLIGLYLWMSLLVLMSLVVIVQ